MDRSLLARFGSRFRSGSPGYARVVSGSWRLDSPRCSPRSSLNVLRAVRYARTAQKGALESWLILPRFAKGGGGFARLGALPSRSFCASWRSLPVSLDSRRSKGGSLATSLLARGFAKGAQPSLLPSLLRRSARSHAVAFGWRWLTRLSRLWFPGARSVSRLVPHGSPTFPLSAPLGRRLIASATPGASVAPAPNTQKLRVPTLPKASTRAHNPIQPRAFFIPIDHPATPPQLLGIFSERTPHHHLNSGQNPTPILVGNA